MCLENFSKNSKYIKNGVKTSINEKKLLITFIFRQKLSYLIIITYLCNKIKKNMLIIEYEDEAIETLIKTGQSNDKRYKKLTSNTRFKNGDRC